MIPAHLVPPASCPDCLSWGYTYGSQSYCRACYDFTRRYHAGECAGCQRIIAVKKGHSRLCWLQAGITAAGRRGLTAADFRPGAGQQPSFAGMSRLGSTGPRPADFAPRPPQSPALPGGTQLELPAPGSPAISTRPTGSHRPSPARHCARPGISPPGWPETAAGTRGSSARPAGRWPSSWPAIRPGT